MFTSFSRRDLVVAILLAVLMIATRGHHLAAPLHLPDASNAIFFLAGLYLQPAILLPVLLVEAVAIDYAAITWGGVSSFCVTPAYLLLIPAFGALWLAGRWYARRFADLKRHPLAFGATLLFATMLAELLTSGGFYFLSGRFAEPTLGAFADRLATYAPPVLAATAMWVGIAVLVDLALAARRRSGGAAG